MIKMACLVSLICASPAGVLAQVPANSPIDAMLGCLDTSDPTLRLACFDREGRAARNAISARDVVILNGAEVRRTRRSLFGLSLPDLKLLGDGKDAKKEQISKLETTISSVRGGGGYGLYVMTLAEGGNWQTIEASRDFSPAAGQSIVIRRGPVGNYNANVAGGRAMRVKRVN